MTEPRRLDVKTDDGTAAVWIHRPDDAPHPGIVMYPDAGSVRPASQAMAARLAKAGFVVLLPNIFYRSGEYAPFDIPTVFSDPPERERLMAILKSLDSASAMRDAVHYMRVLKEQPNVQGERIGAVGYCIGGRLAFTSATAHPKSVGPVAAIHGGHIVTDAPNSPHLGASKIETKLYFAIADNDDSCSPAHQGTLARTLAAAHLDFTMEQYKGAAHGFTMEDFPVFDREASERHWTRVIELFESAR